MVIIFCHIITNAKTAMQQNHAILRDRITNANATKSLRLRSKNRYKSHPVKFIHGLILQNHQFLRPQKSPKDINAAKPPMLRKERISYKFMQTQEAKSPILRK